MSILTLDQASAAVGQSFAVVLADGQELALQLASVTPSKRGPQTPGGRTPFSMLFTGTRGICLPQGIYKLRNETLGEQEIFLVPVRREPGTTGEADSYTYQAVFN